MTIETYKCTETRMVENTFYCMENGVTFFVDEHCWIKAGDIVKCEKDEDGKYLRIWVNDELKTENYYEYVNG